MKNTRVEAIPALEGWLIKQGIAQGDVRKNIKNVRSFCSAYGEGVFRRQVDMGISVKSARNQRPNVLLHMIWPSNIQPEDMREKDIIYYQALFSVKVASPALPAVSFSFDIRSFDSQRNPEKVFPRIAREKGFRHIGVINQIWSYECIDAVTDILGKSFRLAEKSRNIIGDIHNLTWGIASKSPEEQAAILTQARRMLNSVSKGA